MRQPRHRSAKRGQALVETAFAVPIFLLLLFGIFEFGRAFFEWQALYRTAVTGARGAAMAPLDQIETQGLEAIDRSLGAYPGIAEKMTKREIEIPDDFNSDPIKVTLQAPFRPILSNFIPGFDLTLTARASSFYASIGSSNLEAMLTTSGDADTGDGGGTGGGGEDSGGTGDGGGGGGAAPAPEL